MDISSVIIFSVLMLLGASVLMISHVRSWRAFQKQDLDAADFDYRRRQFRRRMQTSAMLALLAVAVSVGYVLTLYIPWPLFAPLYWLVVMAVVCWVGLLALVDIWATKHHFGRLRHQCLLEQAKLQAELRHMQSIRGNGKAGTGNVERGTKGMGSRDKG